MNRTNKNERGDIVKILALLVAIPAAVVAIVAVAKIFHDRAQTNRKVQEIVRMAENYQHVDDFSSALEELDKALVLRPDDRDLQVRRVELETFRMATQYDQTHILQDLPVLSGLRKNCDRLLSEAESARVIALCGIVEDLH